MTSHGSHPARSAADILLIGGHVDAILDAVDEGRQLWQRVQSAVAVLLGGNAGEVAFALIGSAIGGRAPLNARQLLLVNLFTDALPAAALAVSPPNRNHAYDGRGPDSAALCGPSRSAGPRQPPAPASRGASPRSPGGRGERRRWDSWRWSAPNWGRH